MVFRGEANASVQRRSHYDASAPRVASKGALVGEVIDANVLDKFRCLSCYNVLNKQPG
jgi:hypothetical protein